MSTSSASRPVVLPADVHAHEHPPACLVRFYERRTARHIRRVGYLLSLLDGHIPDVTSADITHRGQIHDASKYEMPELLPYIWMTWQRRTAAAMDHVDRAAEDAAVAAQQSPQESASLATIPATSTAAGEKEPCEEPAHALRPPVAGIYPTPPCLAGDVLTAAIAHHLAHNRHHIEYHSGGVAAMTPLDLGEMVCDWTAIGEEQAASMTASCTPWCDRMMAEHAFPAASAALVRHCIAVLDDARRKQNDA